MQWRGANTQQDLIDLGTLMAGIAGLGAHGRRIEFAALQ